MDEPRKEILSNTSIGSSDLWLRKLLRKLRTTSLDAAASIMAGSRRRLPFKPLYNNDRFSQDNIVLSSVKAAREQNVVKEEYKWTDYLSHWLLFSVATVSVAVIEKAEIYRCRLLLMFGF